jgi:hypothetical protein
MARRYSEHEVDEYVEAVQIRRLDERLADPEWEYVEDDLSAAIGGGTWRRRVVYQFESGGFGMVGGGSLAA